MAGLNRLSAAKVSKTTKTGRYADGGGLYLQVSKWGTKSWLLRYMLDGKARQMGLGSVNTFSLKEARDRARGFRQLLADGIDPIEHRKGERHEQRLQDARAVSFKQCADEYIADNKAGWKNAKHASQ